VTFCTTGTTTLTTTGATEEHSQQHPAGLVIDATTGQIDLAASTPITTTLLTALEQRHVRELLLRSNDIKPTNSNSEWRNILYTGNNNTYDDRSNRRNILSNTRQDL
jgi:ABC-type antimicrobial peptide transport system ATPase subunit